MLPLCNHNSSCFKPTESTMHTLTHTRIYGLTSSSYSDLMPLTSAFEQKDKKWKWWALLLCVRTCMLENKDRWCPPPLFPSPPKRFLSSHLSSSQENPKFALNSLVHALQEPSDPSPVDITEQSKFHRRSSCKRGGFKSTEQVPVSVCRVEKTTLLFLLHASTENYAARA